MSHLTFSVAGSACLIMLAAATAGAQTTAPAAGTISIGAGFDLLNTYLFRGVRQNSTKLVMWPAIDFTAGAYDGHGLVKSISMRVDFRNSLHTGDTGLDGPSGELWYELNVAATLQLRLGGGVMVGTGYSTYVSPADMYTTVQEWTMRLGIDERATVGSVALQPYAFAAFELTADGGEGQLDGGLHAGRYLEFGAAPLHTAGRVRVELPVRLGLSIGDYYELGSSDHAYGFSSVGGRLTVPFGEGGGGWYMRGGIEYQRLGDAPKVFNRGDGSEVVASFGGGWSR